MWQVRESNATNWGQILAPFAPQETIQFLSIPFNWSPGIRAGVGYLGQEKPWSLSFYYTGYKTRGKNQASTTSEEIHPAFSSNFYANNPQGNGVSGPYYHRAGIQWDVSYNTLDLELGRSFVISPLLSLRPLIALKAAAINQSIDSLWQQPFEPTTPANPTPTPITSFTTATETISNDFKGLGPALGLDTSWNLYATSKHRLNLIANASGALLWSKWTFSDLYQNNSPQRIATKSDSITSSAWMARALLGFDWSTAMKNADWNIRLGYEIQAWFNQLQYYSFDMGKTNDTLYLQGAVLGLGIYF